MQTHIAFVLVSDEAGCYAHFAAAAIDCLRYVHPRSIVTIVCDSETDNLARKHYSRVLDRADHVKVVPTIERGAPASRELKMRLREIITGPFFYIDSDAFVIDQLPTTVTGSAEFSIAIDAGVNRKKLKRWHHQLGWDIPGTYYNGGVFWADDTPAVHQLFLDWQRYWKQFRSVGSYSDQPALNRALSKTTAPISTLDSRYNAVFHADPSLVRNAAILHFFASDKTLIDQTIFGDLIKEVVDTGRLSPASIARLRNTRYPWKDPYRLRGNFYAGRLLQTLASAPICVWRRFTSTVEPNTSQAD